MKFAFFKIMIKISAVTAGIILLYESADLMLIYHYLKFEYYIAVIAIAALIAGVVLTRKHYIPHLLISTGKNPVDDLTNKEFQILTMISEGKSNKEIAAINFVELSTVKTHINNIYNKLGVKNRKGAIESYQKYLTIPKSTFSPPLLT